MTKPAGYSVDISLPAMRCCIEADGPTHMARNAPGHLLGHTAMKRRHLQLLGWLVINVTFQVGGGSEWPGEPETLNNLRT